MLEGFDDAGLATVTVMTTSGAEVSTIRVPLPQADAAQRGTSPSATTNPEPFGSAVVSPFNAAHRGRPVPSEEPPMSDSNIAEMRAIHERAGKRALTPDEEARWDELKDGAEREAVIARAKTHGQSGDGARSSPSNYADPGRDRAPEYSTAARTIEEAHRCGLLPDYAAERATALITTGARLGAVSRCPLGCCCW